MCTWENKLLLGDLSWADRRASDQQQGWQTEPEDSMFKLSMKEEDRPWKRIGVFNRKVPIDPKLPLGKEAGCMRLINEKHFQVY